MSQNSQLLVVPSILASDEIQTRLFQLQMDGFAVVARVTEGQCSLTFGLKVEKPKFYSQYSSETNIKASFKERNPFIQTSPAFRVLGLDFLLILKF